MCKYIETCFSLLIGQSDYVIEEQRERTFWTSKWPSLASVTTNLVYVALNP